MSKMTPTMAPHMAKPPGLARGGLGTGDVPHGPLVLTWVDKTIEAMPNGKQHRTVHKIAQTR
jgi:hypothetical protein